MQVRLSETMRTELNEILDLHNGYFGRDVSHIKAAINGSKDESYLDKSVKEIILKVEEASGVSYQIMKGKKRHRNIVVSRHYAMYQVVMKLNPLGYTLMEIADFFNRDHSTVLYAHNQIKKLIEIKDPLVTNIHNNYEQLENQSA